MGWVINGCIETQNEEYGCLAECRIEVYFERNVSPEFLARERAGFGIDFVKGKDTSDQTAKIDAGTPSATNLKSPLAARVSTSTNASGSFQITLPDRSELAGNTLKVVVSAPSGVTIAEESFTYETIHERMRILVRTVEPIQLRFPKDISQPLAYRITGKVIERNGKALPAGLQVIVQVRRNDTKERSVHNETPVLVARTDASGYFFGDVPNEKCVQAVGLIAGFAKAVPIALENGFIPMQIPLLIELPETDVASADSGSLQFNMPNRAIEEFEFYSVVRTTEPDIQGMTVVGGAFSFDDTSYKPSTLSLELATKAAEAEVEAVKAEAALESANNAVSAAKLEITNLEQAISAFEQQTETLKGYNPALSAQYSAQAAAFKEIVQVKKVQLDALIVAATQAEATAKLKRASANEVAAKAAEAAETDRAVFEARNEAAAREAAREAKAIDALKNGKLQARGYMDASNPVDWDSTPTFYQAVTIAHGHLLHFKQVWYEDGYSLGDLLYSLPLAPGQKKMISVVEWERRESVARSEATFGSEELNAALSRDRDLGEIVTGALTESARGGSKSTSSGVGAGVGAAGNGSYQGINFGALIGVSGGYGESDSSAWQDSARNLASGSMQSLRDRIVQSASAIRGLRTSVVHTVSQGEAVKATTEVVANHNHGHSMTIQYFEVLRHLKVVHELADVKECLFVPLPMSEFLSDKALRWRQALQSYLIRKDLGSGFDALRRTETAWSQVDYPIGRYADESVTSLIGELKLTFLIPLPPFPERPKPKPEDPADQAKRIAEAVNPTSGFLGVCLAIATGGASVVVGAAVNSAIDATKAVTSGARAMADELYYQPTAKERYDKFHYEIMPGIVQSFVDQLELCVLIGTEKVQNIKADFALVSEYQPGKPLLVSVRCSALEQIRRTDIRQVIVRSTKGLPNGCRVIINSATIRYRTATFEHCLVDDSTVNDDIDLPRVAAIFDNLFDFTIQKYTEGQGATLYTPIDSWEQRNPRSEDRRLAAELLEHLNDNLEFYHHAIWWTMDPNRRYMLLDGYLAPGANGRSVASVVENKLIGIIGNSLVLPVAQGNQLDPRFKKLPVREPLRTGKITHGYEGDLGFKVVSDYSHAQSTSLIDFYGLQSPVPPARVSLPTRGVFAEAVLGSNNVCEKIDDSRFWRWEDSPIDEPPVIESASTSSRRAEAANTQPTPFPTPIVSIQNTPAAPDPNGLRSALDLLGKQSFADITGLAGTQANAAQAYSKAMDTALAFGKEASVLAQQAGMQKSLDKTMSTIDKAETEKKISPEEAKSLRLSALKKSIGDDTSGDANVGSVQKKLDIINNAKNNNTIKPDVAQQLNEKVLTNELIPTDTAKNSNETMMNVVKGIDPNTIQELDVTPEGGVKVINAGHTAPAQKTGLSGLVDKNGVVNETAKAVLDNGNAALTMLGTALSKWKEAPDATLTHALVETISSAALKGAEEITDEVPLIRAMKLATKYSLVFAEGIGEGIDQANLTLRAKYQQELSGTDGLSSADYEAIMYQRRWQANNLLLLNAILMSGVNRVLQTLATEFSDYLSSAATKTMFSWSKNHMEHLLNKTPLSGLTQKMINSLVNEIPEMRREIYTTALSSSFKLWVLQLDNSDVRKNLKGLSDNLEKNSFEKAVIKSLASCFVESSIGDPSAKDKKSLLANLRSETRQWLLQHLNKLIVNRPQEIALVPTSGELAIVGDTIHIPQSLLNQIAACDSAATDDDYERTMSVGRAIMPLIDAAAARIRLLARIRCQQFNRIYSDNSPEFSADIFTTGLKEAEEICYDVTRKYIEIGGDPDVATSDYQIPFEWFDYGSMERQLRSYSLIGVSGGGHGSFSTFISFKADI